MTTIRVYSAEGADWWNSTDGSSNLTRISHDLGARLEAVAVRAAAQEDRDEKMDFKNVMDFTPKKTFKINVSGEPWRF